MDSPKGDEFVMGKTLQKYPNTLINDKQLYIKYKDIS
jgi:hypothetical protein